LFFEELPEKYKYLDREQKYLDFKNLTKKFGNNIAVNKTSLRI